MLVFIAMFDGIGEYVGGYDLKLYLWISKVDW